LPVRSWTIVLGKSLAGALIAGSQGVLMISIAGLAHIPYDPRLIAAVLATLFLAAFALSAFGVMLAIRLTQPTTFNAVVQMIAMPLLALSGGMFPLSGLPGWLQLLTRLDPLTYAVDPIRNAVLSRLDLSAATRRHFVRHVSWGGWPVPTWLRSGSWSR
jgi:ABC-2 type transport system permease protein